MMGELSFLKNFVYSLGFIGSIWIIIAIPLLEIDVFPFVSKKKHKELTHKLNSEIKSLESFLEIKRNNCIDLIYEKEKLERLVERRNDELYSAAEALKKGNQEIPVDVLKKLIFLCHADKHNGSELANEMTVYLLKLRGTK